MKGTQFSGFTYCEPKPIRARITVTLIATMMALAKADWRMPT